MTTALITFKSILAFAGAEMQSLEFTLPARGIPSSEWTEAHGCTCGWARCCWTVCLFKVTVHSDYSGFCVLSPLCL